MITFFSWPYVKNRKITYVISLIATNYVKQDFFIKKKEKINPKASADK